MTGRETLLLNRSGRKWMGIFEEGGVGRWGVGVVDVVDVVECSSE
jgi:hypothetical protein